MSPKENRAMMSCAVKTALLVTYQSATAVYSKVVSDLARHTGDSSAVEYEKLRAEAEKARSISIAARNDLNVHTLNTAGKGC
jgi:hypothetical protein